MSFNSDHVLRLSRARTRIDAGLVEVGEFDQEREGWTAEQGWTAMQQLLPLKPDSVVTHGDFSLDNLLIGGGEVVGRIDVGRVGIADRYQDLAILWNSLGEFGPSLQERFFEQYGIADPNRQKLQFYLMLDELFESPKQPDPSSRDTPFQGAIALIEPRHYRSSLQAMVCVLPGALLLKLISSSSTNNRLASLSKSQLKVENQGERGNPPTET